MNFNLIDYVIFTLSWRLHMSRKTTKQTLQTRKSNPETTSKMAPRNAYTSMRLFCIHVRSADLERRCPPPYLVTWLIQNAALSDGMRSWSRSIREMCCALSRNLEKRWKMAAWCALKLKQSPLSWSARQTSFFNPNGFIGYTCYDVAIWGAVYD